ncbi:MAG: alpha/beta hydrolase [Actinophytocola sp.]|uniref:alpha/beta hydrolase n=1 Tax=Actinophytocola sp. TaxID=1872138 RepID=UPI003C732AE8
MPRWLVVGATTTVVVVVVVLALAYFFQRKLIYLPSNGPLPPAARVLPGARDVRLTTGDGLTLGAWYVPATGPGLGFTVLVANGNGGDRSHRTELAAALRAEGLSVLLFDYRGYGGNPGDPSADGLALDVRAAHAYLAGELRVPRDRLVYFGESLGGAVVTELAVEHPPSGLVLRSPFTELADTAAEHYPFLPVRMLLRDRFPVAEQVRRIDVPTTVVYGTADSVVPPGQSRAVAEAAAGPVRVVEIRGADHNDPVLVAGSRVVDAVVELVNSRR